jgi:predicted dehydrogenase
MRFGLIGTGHWARVAHATAITAHPDTQLVGVWGRDAAKAVAVAEEFGARAYEALDGMLADVEAVAVAVPPDVQADLAARAAAAGRHLLLDKPLAFTTEAADALVAAAAAGGVRSVVFFTQRFHRPNAGWLDEVVREPGWFAGQVTHYGNIFGPDSPYAASPWRRTHGALWDIGAHALSVLLPVLGPVESVVAHRGPGDAVHVGLTHAGGAGSTMSLALTAPPGSLHWEPRFFGATRTVTMPHPQTTPQQALAGALDVLVDRVTPDPWTHPCDVRFGRDVVAVLEAAQHFLDTGAAVAVPAFLTGALG